MQLPRQPWGFNSRALSKAGERRRALSKPSHTSNTALLIQCREAHAALLHPCSHAMMTQTVECTPGASCTAVLSGRRELSSESSLVTVIPGGLWSPEVTASASSHRQTAPQVLELPRKPGASTAEPCSKLVRDAGHCASKAICPTLPFCSRTDCCSDTVASFPYATCRCLIAEAVSASGSCKLSLSLQATPVA